MTIDADKIVEDSCGIEGGAVKRFGSTVATLALFAAIASTAAPCLVPAPQKQEWNNSVCVIETNRVSESIAAFKTDAKLPAEGYRIVIAERGITVEHADAAGAFYAMKTLEQLARPAGDKKRPELAFQCGMVEDFPAYRWRGVMLDEGRHFFGKEAVRRLLDQMADHKLNVFHWHLTEDQGWRIDLKKFPELARYGSVRPESVSHGSRGIARDNDAVMNGEKYGPFAYTEEDIAEILAYAAARHIAVIPEIELPGHIRALLAAHPEFSCAGNLARVPRTIHDIESDVLCAGNDEAIRYLESVLDEVCRIFPDSRVHIGGDECPKDRWKTCPKCQARIRSLALGDEVALQGWVTRRFADYLVKKGRSAIGWDEVFGGNPDKSTMIQAWHVRHGNKYGLKAAEAGYPVIVSALHATYFSLPQGTADDPYTYLSPGGRCSLGTAYGFDPLDGMSARAAKNVIGAECCMWSECTWNLYDLEFKLWPRAAAFAEAVWTAPAAPRDFADFESRMSLHRKRLIRKGVNCAPLN